MLLSKSFDKLILTDYVVSRQRFTLPKHPVSFHKFWNTDPRKIYRKWFHDSDTELAALKASLAVHSHTEL